jgi:hypothetical protein
MEHMNDAAVNHDAAIAEAKELGVLDVLATVRKEIESHMRFAGEQ